MSIHFHHLQIISMLRLFFTGAFPRALTQSFAPITRPNSIFFRTMASSQRSNLQISKLFDVSKLTAVVTGGGTGIGLMITQALQSNGAKVYITGRREEALN